MHVATMVAGLVRGLDHEDAARFSFLLATPIILAAGVYKLPDLLGPNGNGVLGQVLAGSVAAGIAAYLSARFLSRYFTTRDAHAVCDLLPRGRCSCGRSLRAVGPRRPQVFGLFDRCILFVVVRRFALLLPAVATGLGQKRPVFGRQMAISRSKSWRRGRDSNPGTLWVCSFQVWVRPFAGVR
jgi:hypothetical protein